jgi:L-threonylcarbamoyladenylate synthase
MKIIQQNKKKISEIITALKNGAVLVLPTDTVYGLVCDVTNKKAVEKIYKIKKRSKSKPLTIFVKDLKMAKEFAEISKEQEKILVKHWPGKYTFIFKTKKAKKFYGVNKKTIAIRIPKYKFLNDLLKKIDKPLAQTSANISGAPASTKIDQIIKVIATSDVAILVVDGGDLKKSKPSKIINVTSKLLTRLR